jgi:hypothetical protein
MPKGLYILEERVSRNIVLLPEWWCCVKHTMLGRIGDRSGGF